MNYFYFTLLIVPYYILQCQTEDFELEDEEIYNLPTQYGLLSGLNYTTFYWVNAFVGRSFDTAEAISICLSATTNNVQDFASMFTSYGFGYRLPHHIRAPSFWEDDAQQSWQLPLEWKVVTPPDSKEKSMCLTIFPCDLWNSQPTLGSEKYTDEDQIGLQLNFKLKNTTEELQVELHCESTGFNFKLKEETQDIFIKHNGFVVTIPNVLEFEDIFQPRLLTHANEYINRTRYVYREHHEPVEDYVFPLGYSCSEEKRQYADNAGIMYEYERKSLRAESNEYITLKVGRIDVVPNTTSKPSTNPNVVTLHSSTSLKTGNTRVVTPGIRPVSKVPPSSTRHDRPHKKKCCHHKHRSCECSTTSCDSQGCTCSSRTISCDD